jgi:hypothetical protein
MPCYNHRSNPKTIVLIVGILVLLASFAPTPVVRSHFGAKFEPADGKFILVPANTLSRLFKQ